MGIKDWFRKKVKLPVTDSIETVSKTSYKKDKPKQKLSEDRTIISRKGTPETTTTTTTKVEQEKVRLNPTDNELQTLDKTHKTEATKPASLQRLSPKAIPKYSRILVPHDGSEISDKALAHTIYQSKISGAEIVILNVVEHIESKESSTMTATVKGEGEGGGEFDRTRRADLEITVEGEVKQMIEDKIRLCKEAGVTSQISYKIQTGKPVDEIVKLAEEMNIDLIVMASSKIISPVMVLGSITRRVIDGTKKPVLVIL